MEIYYYRNQFTAEVVGIVGDRLFAGVVYGPAVNLPTEPEHFVPLIDGVDGRDGKTFHPEFWDFREVATI